MPSPSLLFAVSASLGWARRPVAPAVQRVPTIDEVVEGEGFTPTPSQSEMYRPGAVLVPNTRGGHDVVVADCIGVEPSIAIMSQSSIATTLSAGVSARMAAARGEVTAGIEKRLSFVDPEQRTISLGQLRPSETCLEELQTATQLQDLSEAVVLNDVLVAIVQNTVCTRADASGRVVALGEAEAAAYSECVQESDAQVPLGYKALPLDKVLAVVDAPMPTASAPTSSAAASPAAATSSVSFGNMGGLGVQEKLREQACDEEAQSKGTAARAARLSAAARDAQSKATVAWAQLAGEAQACTKLERAQRTPCIEAVEGWLAIARTMPLDLPAGVERVDTDCGTREPAFPGERKVVAAQEVSTAEDILKRLQAADAPKSGELAKPTLNISRSHLSDKSDAYRKQAREKRHESMAFLKDILANRSPSGEQKAEMMLRLAELYQEEGLDIAIDSPNSSEAVKWIDRSVRLFEQIWKNYPAYQRADHATFYQAQGLHYLGREKESIQLHTTLVRTYPQSAFIPDAYVYIGEYYFDQNNAYKALLAYQKATRYKDSKQYPFAQYKLSWCYFNVGEYGKAIDTMKAVVAYAAKNDGNERLEKEALKDLVRFFRDAGQSEEGRGYFNKLRRSDLADQL